MPASQTTHGYTVHLTPEPEGGYTVTVPALPGCITWGENLFHALEMARECIQGFIESLQMSGAPVPTEPAPRECSAFVEVEVPFKT